MATLLMYLINENPSGGPVWFGAICDILMIICLLSIFKKS